MNATFQRDIVAEPQRPVSLVTASAEQPAKTPSSTSAECGSGWYHDVAISESQKDPARKH